MTATYSTDTALTASYDIVITVDDACSIANLQLASSYTDPPPLYYTGSAVTEIQIGTDQPGCPWDKVFHECSVFPLIAGDSSCDFSDASGNVVSQFDTALKKVTIDMSLNTGDYVTQFPPDTFTYTITGSLPAWSNSQVSHSFPLDLVDVCSSTSLTLAAISDSTYQTDEPPFDISVAATDTASSTYGNQDGFTQCGDRSYNLLEPVPLPDWLSFDSATGIVTVDTLNNSPATGTDTEIKIDISLVIYPSIIATETFKITFDMSCNDSTLTVPTSTSMIYEIYYVGGALSSQSYADLYTLTTLDTDSDCGALQIDWTQKSLGGTQ